MKNMLQAEFSMKDLGLAMKILGMNTLRSRDKQEIFLNQMSHFDKLVDKFAIRGGCKTYKTTNNKSVSAIKKAVSKE